MEIKLNRQSNEQEEFCRDIFINYPKSRLCVEICNNELFELYKPSYNYVLCSLYFRDNLGYVNFIVKDLTDEEEIFIKLKYGN